MILEKINNITCFDIETAGLNPLTAGITCICAIDEQGTEFKRSIPQEGMTNHATIKDEIQLIIDFVSYLMDRDYTTLLTFNGRMFDLPFILSRLTYLLNSVPEEHITLRSFRMIDLFELTPQWVSLDSHCKILGLESKTGTGTEAIRLWKQGLLEDLENYCMQDVKVTFNLYKKLLECRQ